MAVQVVLDVPGAGGFARLGRGIVVVLGALLVLAGALVAPFVVVMVLLMAYTSADDSGDSTPPTGSEVIWTAVTGVLVVVAIWLGVRLLRGRRRLGLYLRKFGYGDSTRAVTTALTSAVGRRVRVVTLDDAMVAPVGVPRGRRVVAALVFVVFAGLAAWGLYFLFGGGLEQEISDAAAQAAQQVSDDPSLSDDPAASIIAPLFGAVIGAAITAIVLALLVGIPVLLAIGIALLAASAYVSAALAGRLAKRTIDSDQAIAPTAKTFARASRRVFSPRLFVARVKNSVWPQAVHGLGAASDVVIIDVSHPTDAMLWEVQTMRQMFGGRWVLVGAHEYVAPLADPRTAAGTDHRARLAQLLDGHEVLAYGHTPAEHTRFVTSLRNRLQRVAAARA